MSIKKKKHAYSNHTEIFDNAKTKESTGCLINSQKVIEIMKKRTKAMWDVGIV